VEGEGPGLRATLITALPFATAIGVFGVVFGAAASATIDPLLVAGMSLLIFSGSLQFALVALLVGGAGPAVLLFTTMVLNLRHVVFGAVLRPRIEGGLLRRAFLGFFMIDESFGLALAAGKRAATVLAVSGSAFYIAWQIGTVLGVLGARAVALEEVARAIFPVLFIGLAALTARGIEGSLRALAAAALVVLAALSVPALFDYAPIVAAILVAIPPRRSASPANPSAPPAPESAS
jgi:predicted branched-subunit amino acid permease